MSLVCFFHLFILYHIICEKDGMESWLTSRSPPTVLSLVSSRVGFVKFKFRFNSTNKSKAVLDRISVEPSKRRGLRSGNKHAVRSGYSILVVVNKLVVKNNKQGKNQVLTIV